MLSMGKNCCSQNFKAASFSLIFKGSASDNSKIFCFFNRLTALADVRACGRCSVRCPLTVAVEMNSFSAISLLLKPFGQQFQDIDLAIGQRFNQSLGTGKGEVEREGDSDRRDGRRAFTVGLPARSCSPSLEAAGGCLIVSSLTSFSANQAFAREWRAAISSDGPVSIQAAHAAAAETDGDSGTIDFP